MDFFNLLTLAGGLALFLYGMQLMGDGLKKTSGGRMEQILEKLTSNKWKAVLLGAGVTAVIQSSSATTVMVVGFVNSGIMKLSQAIGVIMGANIGTTVTSWILSLAGIEGSNFFIRLLKPSSFSPVLALIGMGFFMFAKSEKKKDIATIMVGFAILMFGMQTMSGAVEPLADVPEFTEILLMFSNPILGMLAGAVLTAVIQSSSASVGILQALCVTGSVSFGTALPIIMGQNIGTCVTALLSSMGASKNAKRAAFIHFYFNLIGTAIFMVIFYLINSFLDFTFLNEPASAVGIAVIHSIFNIFATTVMLPLSGLLEKLACLTIRDGKTEEEVSFTEEDLKILDERFLNSPSLAMEQCRKATSDMAEATRKSWEQAVRLIGNFEQKKADYVMQLEKNVDRYEDALGSYLVKLSAKNLSERDSQSLSILLHCIGDFERISDHAVNITMAAKEMYEKKQSFSEKALEELKVYTQAINGILNVTIDVFRQEDMELALEVESLEEVINQLNAEVKKRHIKRLRKGKCTIELGFILSDIITSFERIAAHCSHITVNVMQSRDESFELHEYKENLKNRDRKDFETLFSSLQQQYALPE